MDLLSSHEQAAGHGLRQHLVQPGPAGVHDLISLETGTAAGDQSSCAACCRERQDLISAVHRTAGTGIGHHRLHRPPRQQRAAVRLEDGPALIRHLDLRIASVQHLGIQHFVSDTGISQRRQGLLCRSLPTHRHPQHAGRLEQLRPGDLIEELTPLRQ